MQRSLFRPRVCMHVPVGTVAHGDCPACDQIALALQVEFWHGYALGLWDADGWTAQDRKAQQRRRSA